MTQVFARLETVKRSPTWGAVAKLGYLCRRGRFAARRDLVAGPRQVLPPGAPRRYSREDVLWSEADSAEKLGHVAAIEIVVALPLEVVSRHDWIDIALTFAQIIAYHYGVAITVVVHAGTNTGDEADANPHAHLLITSRTVTTDGLAPRRIDALLPTMSGWRHGAAIIPIALDAAPIAALYRCTLELYFAQQGKSDALDLNPPHAQIHVGPTAAVGARIANSEDIARLPNAAEIFDKLERIEINTRIAARNVAAIRDIDGLVDHLSGAPFTRTQLARLVGKHIKSPLEARSIVEAVLDHCHCFTENGESVGDLLVTGRYLKREASIANLASDLGAPWPQGNKVLADPAALGESLANRGGLAIVELPAKGLQVPEIATGLVEQGLVPIQVAHLAKTSTLSSALPARALHWRDAFKLNVGEIGLVDEADMLSAPELERLLHAAHDAGARLVLLRRPGRPGWSRSAVLDALSRRLGCAHLGRRITPDSTARAILAQDLAALVRVLIDDDKCHRASSEIEQISAAIAKSQRLAAKGLAPFILCRDPERAAACLFAARDLKTKIVLGASLPPGHRGPVIIVHGHKDGLGDLLGQLLMCDIELVTTNVLTPDTDALVRAFRRGSGHMTSLEFAPHPYRKFRYRFPPVRSASLPGLPVGTHGISRPDGQLIPDEGRWSGALDDFEDAIASGVGLEPDDISDLDTGDFEDDIGPSDHDGVDLDRGDDFEPDLDCDIDEEPDPHSDPPEDHE